MTRPVARAPATGGPGAMRGGPRGGGGAVVAAGGRGGGGGGGVGGAGGGNPPGSQGPSAAGRTPHRGGAGSVASIGALVRGERPSPVPFHDRGRPAKLRHPAGADPLVEELLVVGHAVNIFLEVLLHLQVVADPVEHVHVREVDFVSRRHRPGLWPTERASRRSAVWPSARSRYVFFPELVVIDD